MIEELGRRVRQRRVAQDLTQVELADAAGVPLRTIERLEAGTSIGLDKFMQVMRTLKMSENVDQLLPEYEVRPLQQIGAKTVQRKRVSTSRRAHEPKVGGWVWGDKK